MTEKGAKGTSNPTAIAKTTTATEDLFRTNCTISCINPLFGPRITSKDGGEVPLSSLHFVRKDDGATFLTSSLS